MPLPVPLEALEIIDTTTTITVDGSPFSATNSVGATTAGNTMLIIWSVRTAKAGAADSVVITDNKANPYTIIANGDMVHGQPSCGVAISKNVAVNTGTVKVEMTAHLDLSTPGPQNFGMNMVVVVIGAGLPTINVDVQQTEVITGQCISPNGHDSCSILPMVGTVTTSTGAPFSISFCNVGNNRDAALIDIFDGVGTDNFIAYQGGYASSSGSGFVPDPVSPLDTLFEVPAGFSFALQQQIGFGNLCLACVFFDSVFAVAGGKIYGTFVGVFGAGWTGGGSS